MMVKCAYGIQTRPAHPPHSLPRVLNSDRHAVSTILTGLFLGLLLPAMPLAGKDTGLSFTDIAPKAGLIFRHSFGATHLKSILMTTGSGVALVDYDNDGWLDALLINGTPLDSQGGIIQEKALHHALFHNRGDGTFENVTARAGLSAPSYGQGVACGDFDGDGFTDLYITNYGPNQLLHNLGDGRFEDVTQSSGTGHAGWSTGAVFLDYDGDADMDLYVSSYVSFKPGQTGVHASELSKRTGFRSFPGPRDYPPAADILYRNNGNGTFTDVSREAGLREDGKGLTVTAADLDGDGDQDLFVSNDSTPNFLYRNDRGHFVDEGLISGVALDPQGTETAAMGVDVADVDGDGRPDLYVTNMVFEFNNLYRNLGKFQFEDNTIASGLNKDNYRHVGWATRFEDLDNDGDLDCFVANGHVVDYIEGFSSSVTYAQQNMLFQGDGRGRFKNISNNVGNAFRKKQVSRGAAFGDIDHDGDLDILIGNSGQPAVLLRNDLPPGRRWIDVRLLGQRPNSRGIGAKVTIKTSSLSMTRQVRFASTYLSCSEPTIHMGLGTGETSGRVRVNWPSGRISDVPFTANRTLLIREPKNSRKPATSASR